MNLKLNKKYRLQELMTLVKMTKRDKRAFIDISKPLKSLFGIARETDINKMSTTINQVVHRQDEVLSVASNAYTHTVQLAETVHKQFNNTFRLIKDVHIEIGQLAENMKLDKVATYAAFLKWTEATRKFQAMYTELDNQYARAIEGIKALLYGKLTPNLIPVKDVLHTIRTLHHRLQQHHPAYTSPIHSPQDFYQNTEYYLSEEQGEIFVAVFIPVSHNNGEYQIYHVDTHPYPMAYKSVNMARLSNVQEMLAVSKDRQYFFYPTNRDLSLSCVRQEQYLCFYAPTLTHSSQTSCVHAIFSNQVTIAKNICEYTIIQQQLEPNIYRFDQTQFIMTNVHEYHLDCNDRHETQPGCFYCLVKLACECTISVGTRGIQSLFDQCPHPNTTTTLTYPVNVMVANYIRPNDSIAALLGHQLLTYEDKQTIPPLQIYEHDYQTDIATAYTGQLKLKTVLTNLKTDKVTFKDTADKFLCEHPVFVPSDDSMFSIGNDIIHVLQFLWLTATTVVMIYFACKLKMLGTPILTATLPTARAQTVLYNTEVIMKAIKSNHHIMTICLLTFAIIMLILKLSKFLTKGNKWNTLLWIFCMCQHTRLNPRYWTIYITFPSIPGSIFWKLNKISTHQLPHPALDPGSLATVTLHPIIPYLWYKARLNFTNRPVLRDAMTSFPIHTEFKLNGCLARQFRNYIDRPLCPIIMIEQDGLLFNPIPYIPQEPPSTHTTDSAQSPQPSLESAEALLYKQYADQLYKTHIQGYPTYSQNSYLRDSTQPSTSTNDRFTAQKTHCLPQLDIPLTHHLCKVLQDFKTRNYPHLDYPLQPPLKD